MRTTSSTRASMSGAASDRTATILPPTASPTKAVSSARSALAPEAVTHVVEAERDRRLHLAGGDARRRLAQQLPELALELPHARLARVLADDELEQLIRDLHLVVEQLHRRRR